MKVKVYEPVDFAHPFSTAIGTLNSEQVYSSSSTIEGRKWSNRPSFWKFKLTLEVHRSPTQILEVRYKIGELNSRL